MISWWVLSLIASLFLAVFVYYNQIAKLPSHLMMMYRGFGVAVIMLPVCLIVGVKLHPLFYIFSAIQGLFIGYIDNKFFRSSKVFGAEVTGSLQPISLALTFILWLIIKPESFISLINDPLKFMVILLCLTGIVVSVMLLRKAKLNKKAVLYLLPCIIIAGCGDPFIKIILSYGSLDWFSLFQRTCFDTISKPCICCCYNIFLTNMDFCV